NLDIVRDWGWAPDYVEAMWKMLQQPVPDDYVIATGKSYSLEAFLDTAFEYAGLNWREHVIVDSSLLRPTDLRIGRANPNKAHRQVNWKATHDMHDVVRKMYDGCGKHVG